MSQKAKVKLKDSAHDNEGRYVMVSLEYGQLLFTLACIHAPNRDSLTFLTPIINDLDNLGNDLKIVGGDWNMVLNKRLGSRGGELAKLMNVLGLVLTLI